MTSMDAEGSRIRDVVRNSKIRWDIPLKLDLKFDSFVTEPDRYSDGLRHNLYCNTQLVDGVFPHVHMAEVGRCCYHGKDSVRERNRSRFRSILPTFDGSPIIEEFWEWVDAIDDYFEEMQPPDELKCKIASYTLVEEADSWWQQLQRERLGIGKAKVSSWPRMKRLLGRRFTSANCLMKVQPHIFNYKLGTEGLLSYHDDFDHTMLDSGAIFITREHLEKTRTSMNENAVERQAVHIASRNGFVSNVVHPSGKEPPKQRKDCGPTNGSHHLHSIPVGVQKNVEDVAIGAVRHDDNGSKTSENLCEGESGAEQTLGKEADSDLVEEMVPSDPPKHDTAIVVEEVSMKDSFDCFSAGSMKFVASNLHIEKANLELGAHTTIQSAATKLTRDKAGSFETKSGIIIEKTDTQHLPEQMLSIFLYSIKHSIRGCSYYFDAHNVQHDVQKRKLLIDSDVFMCHPLDSNKNFTSLIFGEYIASVYSNTRRVLFLFDPGGILRLVRARSTKVRNDILVVHGRSAQTLQKKCDWRSKMEMEDARIDLSEYIEQHTATHSIGDPPWSISHERGEQRTQVVRRQPYNVVMYGKLENVPSALFNVLLYILNGRLTDGQGCTVGFANSVVLGTSSLGPEYPLLRLVSKVTKKFAHEFVIKEARKHFMPGLLNRLDEIRVLDPSSEVGKWESQMLLIIYYTLLKHAFVETSLLEVSKLIVLNESSIIFSNPHFSILGQGALNLSGLEDIIDAQRLILLFSYGIYAISSSNLQDFLHNTSHILYDLTPKLNGNQEKCSLELLQPPVDCHIEEVNIEGLVIGSIVCFHVASSSCGHLFGVKSTFGLGCTHGWDEVKETCVLHEILICLVHWILFCELWDKVLFLLVSDLRNHNFRITRGRVIPWEDWNDVNESNTEGKFIMPKLSVVTISSCLKRLCEQRQFKKALKLFHRMVNGLDPPLDVNDKFVKPWCGIIWIRSWTSFRSSRLEAFRAFNVADLTTSQALMRHSQNKSNSRTSLLFWGEMEMMQCETASF